MINFALQNFKSKPFLIKTRRYYTMVKFFNTDLLFFFLKIYISGYLNINFTLFRVLFNKQFTQTLWSNFKKIIFKFSGICFSNLTLSYLILTYKNLIVDNKRTCLINYSNNINTPWVYVQLVNFSFKKKLYNTLVIFFMDLLNRSYPSIGLNFFLRYGFIFFKKNSYLYTFTGKFFHKVYNI